MESQNHIDQQLLDRIIEDLQREGSTCSANSLIIMDHSIRKYLGDRRLVSFLSGMRKYIIIMC
jgi:hypothetical protein